MDDLAPAELDAAMPAELALPGDADVPYPDDLLDRIADLGTIDESPRMLANTDELEWAMRRAAPIRRYVERQRRQRAAWQQQITEWYEHTTRGAERRLMFLDAAMEHYGIAARKANPKSDATIRVMSGAVATRKAAAKVVVDDEEALIAWAVDSLDAELYDAVVKTVRSVLVSELRKVVDVVEHVNPEDRVDEGAASAWLVLYGGERVPGVHVEPESYTAKVHTAIDAIVDGL